MSCKTLLTKTTYDCTNILTKGKVQIDVTFLEISKDFDVALHHRLHMKHYMNGITGKTHRWIKGFLENRTQGAVNRSKYVGKIVKYSVPQDALLSPFILTLTMTLNLNSVDLFTFLLMILHIGRLASMSILDTEVDSSNPGSSMLFP